MPNTQWHFFVGDSAGELSQSEQSLSELREQFNAQRQQLAEHERHRRFGEEELSSLESEFVCVNCFPASWALIWLGCVFLWLPWGRLWSHPWQSLCPHFCSNSYCFAFLCHDLASQVTGLGSNYHSRAWASAKAWERRKNLEVDCYKVCSGTGLAGYLGLAIDGL